MSSPDQYFNIPCVAAPKLISIMSAAVFQSCKTSLIPLMQMSNCALKQDEYLTFTLPFMYLHMQVCSLFDSRWLTDGVFAFVAKQAVFPKGTSWPFCGGAHWGMRVEASHGVKVLFSPILMASGVSARSHSASPHLLRTKRGLVGVYTIMLHSKGVRQGDSSLLPASLLRNVFTSSICLSISVPCSFITQKNSEHF